MERYSQNEMEREEGMSQNEIAVLICRLFCEGRKDRKTTLDETDLTLFIPWSISSHTDHHNNYWSRVGERVCFFRRPPANCTNGEERRGKWKGGERIFPTSVLPEMGEKMQN